VSVPPKAVPADQQIPVGAGRRDLLPAGFPVIVNAVPTGVSVSVKTVLQGLMQVVATVPTNHPADPKADMRTNAERVAGL
jgi:hypothetical protein